MPPKALKLIFCILIWYDFELPKFKDTDLLYIDETVWHAQEDSWGN